MLSDHPMNDAMHDEWIAWQAVVTELQGASASLDINKENQLHAALVLWGEALATLRRTQDFKDCELWLQDALEKYRAAVKK
jgi:hypothetical protein